VGANLTLIPVGVKRRLENDQHKTGGDARIHTSSMMLGGVDVAHSLDVDGAKIERLRLEKAVMNRHEFARKVGVTGSGMWSIERKPMRTRPATLRKIAKVLGVEPQELLRREPPVE
jgi:DNA-binding Xre family transcriptional regulator